MSIFKREKQPSSTAAEPAGNSALSAQTSGDITISAIDGTQENIFFQSRKSVREAVAPHGINPNPLEYMVIADNETNIFTLCYYIHKMPKNTTFATTFSSLFNYPNVTSSVFISPMMDGKASKLLDKRVTSLETERVGAQKEGDTNRLRKLETKIAEANAWAKDIESGNNALFEGRVPFRAAGQ